MEAHSLPQPGGFTLPRSPRLLAAFSDTRLVEHVRRGNEAAFEAIFDRHHRAILSFCRHMLGSADEAEDAVQQTFVSAYDAMRSDARELKLKAWLYAIARNKCLSMLRARRERPSQLDDVPTAGLADEVQQRADLRDLLRDMRDLPEDQRAALVLSELGDLSHAEIGTVVGCDPLKVKSLVFQARSSLIDNRNARDTPCLEIREQLATARGGALRRGPLRKHLKACAGCRAFRDDVSRQRAMAALVLPVVPSVGLKSGALAALGIGGGGAGIAASGGAAVGGVLAVGTGTGTGAVAAGGLKLAAAVVATAAAVGGSGFAVREVARGDDPSNGAAASGTHGTPATAGNSTSAGAPAGIAPGARGNGPAAGLAAPGTAAATPGARHTSGSSGADGPAGHGQLAGKGKGQTKHGQAGTSNGHDGGNPDRVTTDQANPGRGDNAGANSGAGSNAGARAGKGADSGSSNPPRDKTRSTRGANPSAEPKAAHGARSALDQAPVAPGIASALPDPAAAAAKARAKARGRTPTATQ
jgi:RNA polymerase sigma factor (sigma-70 family)